MGAWAVGFVWVGGMATRSQGGPARTGQPDAIQVGLPKLSGCSLSARALRKGAPSTTSVLRGGGVSAARVSYRHAAPGTQHQKTVLSIPRETASVSIQHAELNG